MACEPSSADIGLSATGGNITGSPKPRGGHYGQLVFTYGDRSVRAERDG